MLLVTNIQKLLAKTYKQGITYSLHNILLLYCMIFSCSKFSVIRLIICIICYHLHCVSKNTLMLHTITSTHSN